jgi:hypothetical protein
MAEEIKQKRINSEIILLKPWIDEGTVIVDNGKIYVSVSCHHRRILRQTAV